MSNCRMFTFFSLKLIKGKDGWKLSNLITEDFSGEAKLQFYFKG